MITLLCFFELFQFTSLLKQAIRLFRIMKEIIDSWNYGTNVKYLITSMAGTNFQVQYIFIILLIALKGLN